MASLLTTVCCAGCRIASAVLVVVIAVTSAGAEIGKTLPDAPRFKLFASSHATAAAEVLAYHGVKKGLPQVVLIGGLEGRIYRCDCGKDIDLWDIAAGTRLWAAAEGLKVASEARVLRARSTSSGSPNGEVLAGHKLDFADYRQAIDAKQPVVLTYSLDAASDKGMDASFHSQERVSVVGVGYEEVAGAGPGPAPDTAGGGSFGKLRTSCATSPHYIVALLPEGVGGAEARTGGAGRQEKERERFRRLMGMPGVKRGDREGVLLIPWEAPTGNLIATFVTVEKP